jgi:hypothetical protein
VARGAWRVARGAARRGAARRGVAWRGVAWRGVVWCPVGESKAVGCNLASDM